MEPWTYLRRRAPAVPGSDARAGSSEGPSPPNRTGSGCQSSAGQRGQVRGGLAAQGGAIRPPGASGVGDRLVVSGSKEGTLAAVSDAALIRNAFWVHKSVAWVLMSDTRNKRNSRAPILSTAMVTNARAVKKKHYNLSPDLKAHLNGVRV